MNVNAAVKTAPDLSIPVGEFREFIETEANLLDERRFEEWSDLFAADGKYWAPANHEQVDPYTHVSLFYDEKLHIKTRVERLQHPMLHCQEPPSHCVRVISNVTLTSVSDDGNEYQLKSKFLMLEDRFGHPQRVFGGRCQHTLRRKGNSFEIVLKRVDVTNCDQSFPLLTQPF